MIMKLTPPFSQNAKAITRGKRKYRKYKCGNIASLSLATWPEHPPCTSRSTKSEHHFNSQIWRVQEENPEIPKTQVKLLRRMTLLVHKPTVFDRNILEYPKWENTFDALIEDQVVRPNYKLYYLGEYTCGAAEKNDQQTFRIANRRRLQES